MRHINSFIRGHGSAGLAIAKSLAILKLQHPDLNTDRTVFISRNENLKELVEKERALDTFNVLFIANPHGLHAATIIAGEAAGFDMIFCEKPACISLAEVEMLPKIKTPTFIFHGYRQMWGPRKIKALLDEGQFGELISIEGRYWQSSAAGRGLAPVVPAEKSKIGWKNDPKTSGNHDVLLDLASHWTDLAIFLSPEKLNKVKTHLSFVNAEAPHRDSHVLLHLGFEKNIAGFASISKTVHGAGNLLEVGVLGAKLFAQWSFENPDEIILSRGNSREVFRRDTNALGSQQGPFHGTGWLEGYTEIIHQGFRKLRGENFTAPASLHESIDVVKRLITSEKL